jgi:hypothetical protein
MAEVSSSKVDVCSEVVFADFVSEVPLVVPGIGRSLEVTADFFDDLQEL